MTRLKIAISFLLAFLLFSCMNFTRHKITPTQINLSERRLNRLEKIQRTMVKIVCSAYYENYYYLVPSPKNKNASLEDLLYKKQLTTNSVSGSALILNRNPSNILLLSAYHIFDFPDTVRVFYKDENGNATANLQSVSIKYDQRIFITHHDGTRSLGHLFSSEQRNDIALLETKAAENQLLENSFTAPFAQESDLKFGKEAYLIGYPKGFLFISRGLISPSPYPNKFMVSAAFNRGFSGGIVLAFKEGKDSYVYLGMANSMAYDSQIVLVPDETLPRLDNFRDFPYTDNAYVKELKMVNYGLTFAIKANIIANFLEQERERLRRRGFVLPNKL
ncbi:MAG: serine protease [Calditrichaeota bacterium]|nr:serine protease [Calditrichota bacterium]